MSLLQTIFPNDDALYQLAGITGLGWTVSLMGYLTTIIGYGNNIVTNPQSLLYLGSALLLVTLGLDGLQNTLSNKEN